MDGNNCIFCRIVKKELPAETVYEDEKFLAFLDINPRTKGHTLVIPKEHFRWTYDVPDFGQYWEIAKKVAESQINNLMPEWIQFLTLGWQVNHAHIHVIPRYKEDAGEGFEHLKMEVTAESLSEIKSKIQI